ncbi:MAG TPA: HAD family hydrolase [Candidatus Mediterraneibacter faecavium]|uniref:HAD family hydrolase n=1 Tax=Candidatus Mediterraneibacter faecavium TaxID=2838668 RepID=A0A9D2QB76_9FIRM|nr:HAD family hydrolase [Candidatus Mediterraneibacter faecavium]
MNYKTAIFDLDGTITDSGPGIMNAIRYAVKKRGLPDVPEEVLRSFIGPPLKEQFRSVFGLSDEEGTIMVATYREYYGEKGIFENRVYDGVPEVFQKLQEAGVRILMATSKPEKYAKQIAEHFGFAKYFDFIGGACMDGRRTDKHDVIEYVIDSCKVCRENTVMIGDRRHDMIGASKAGIRSIGALYGYGSRDELEKAGADMIAVTPDDISKLILQ